MAVQLPVREVTAFNTATESENKIHDDAVAASLGFGGGLVPGVDVYGYLCQPAVAHWGRDFLSGSVAEVRFDSPVHDGEKVEVRSTIDDEETLTATAHSPNGPCATLTAHLDPDPAPAPPTVDKDRPATRPPASPDTFVPGEPLGSFVTRCDDAEASEYLRLIRDESPESAALGAVHPAWLLRRANEMLSRNVVLGPWIHVGSRARHLAPIDLGEEITVQGFTSEHYEHKGHRFVVATVVMKGGDGTARCHVEHTAIYEPRQVRDQNG